MSGDWIGWINYWSIALACQPTSSSEYVLCCDELSFIVAPKTVSRIHVVVHHLHHQQQQQPPGPCFEGDKHNQAQSREEIKSSVSDETNHIKVVRARCW